MNTDTDQDKERKTIAAMVHDYIMSAKDYSVEIDHSHTEQAEHEENGVAWRTVQSTNKTTILIKVKG